MTSRRCPPHAGSGCGCSSGPVRVAERAARAAPARRRHGEATVQGPQHHQPLPRQHQPRYVWGRGQGLTGTGRALPGRARPYPTIPGRAGPGLTLPSLPRSRCWRGRQQHAGPSHHPAPQHVPAEGAEVSRARSYRCYRCVALSRRAPLSGGAGRELCGEVLVPRLVTEGPPVGAEPLLCSVSGAGRLYLEVPPGQRCYQGARLSWKTCGVEQLI